MPSSRDSPLYSKPLSNRSFFFGLALLALILLLPAPTGLTFQAKSAIAVFIFALSVWLFRPYAEAATSLLVLALLVILRVQDSATVFGALGSDTNFLVLSGLIISIAMEKTGVARRIALGILTKLGGSPARVLMGLMLVGLAITFLMPSGTARTTMLFPVALAVISAFGVKENENSNMAKQVALTVPASDHLSTSAILTATGANILAIELLNRATQTKVYYSDWIMWAFLPNLALMFIWWILIRKIFPYRPAVLDCESLKGQLVRLGALKSDEKKVLTIFFIVVGLWMTDRWNGLPAAAVALLGASLLFVPRLGVLDWKQDTKNLNWGLLIFNAAAIASGAALGQTKAIDWAAEGVFNRLEIGSYNPYSVLAIVLLIVLVLISLTSSKTGRVTMLVPLLIGFATTMSINPVFLVMPVAFFNAHHFIFPFNAKSNLIYFGSGYLTTTDMAKSGILISIAAVAIYMLTAVTYWRWVGLTP